MSKVRDLHRKWNRAPDYRRANAAATETVTAMRRRARSAGD